MKVYMIVAYPNHNGLSYNAFESARQEFERARHEVRVTDLYAEGFDPVLRFDDEHKRRDLQFDDSTAPYRDNITWADHLVFAFPIWWGGMPAILKGFVDRVFSKGFAYDYKGVMPIGHLTGKTAWIITTHDTPAFYVKLFEQDYGKVLDRQVLKFCGIKTIRRTTLPYTRHTTAAQREQWLASIPAIAKGQLPVQP